MFSGQGFGFDGKAVASASVSKFIGSINTDYRPRSITEDIVRVTAVGHPVGRQLELSSELVEFAFHKGVEQEIKMNRQIMKDWETVESSILSLTN